MPLRRDKGDKKEKKSKKEKKDKDKEKEEDESEEEGGGAGSGGSDGGDASDGDDDVKWSTDTSAAAAAARAVEQLTDGAADLVTAVKGVNLDEPGSGSGSGSGEDDGGDEGDEDEDELVTQLRAFAAKHSGAETAQQLRSLACDGPEHRAHVAVTALLSASPSAPPLKAQAVARAAALKGAAPDAAGAAALLAALEAWLAEAPPAVLKGTALALKALYDADVVDEPALVAWYDAPAAARKFGVSPDGAKAVRKAAHAFVDWLRNAESDEDDDDDE